MKKDFKFYLLLFWTTFQLSAFTFGGGYVIVSLMKKSFVDKYHWITEDEMLDYTAISQSTPGSIAVNAAVLIGYRTAGIAGALITVFATILPPLIILSVISYFYMQFKQNVYAARALAGMQTGVIAVILDVVTNMAAAIFKTRRIVPILLMFICFAAVAFFKVNPVYIILICGLAGALDYLRGRRA